MTTLAHATVDTPIGALHLAARDRRLFAAAFEEQWPALLRRLEHRSGPIALRSDEDPAGAAGALRRYLGGRLDALDGVPVDESIGTPFQRRVWSALRAIPAGATRSYGELAARIASPGAARAVGAANRENPIGLFVPCHRVIRGDDALSGYAGGSERKRWLLAHEGALSA